MELERLRTRAAGRRCADWHEARLAERRWCFSQGDQSVANAAGATVRADINAELQALVSNSSGASAPATTYAYEFWADTTNGVLKQRNAANSGWLVRASLAEAFVIARSSNTILALGDYGKLFKATSTFTQTLTAAATLGDGWWCEYRNDGTGVITIDPNASETIDGQTTLTLGPGASCVIECDGSNFKTVGLGGLVCLARQSASNSATLDFTAGIDGTYDEYVLQLTNIVPATDAADLWVRVSEDAGSSFKAGATDYIYDYNLVLNDASNNPIGSAGDTKLRVTGGIYNTASKGGTCGEIRFFAPSATSQNKHFKWALSGVRNAATTLYSMDGAGVFVLDTNAINAIRLMFSSGNITSGTVALYGVRKA